MSGQPPTFPCAECGAPIHVVHPGGAQSVVCGTCGTQLDLYAAGSPVLGRVQLDAHKPEGLLEVGRSGRLGQLQVQVIGRIRMVSYQGGNAHTWDEWLIITEDARYLRIREQHGEYFLMLAFEVQESVPAGFRERLEIGSTVPFDGEYAHVVSQIMGKVLHVEGELSVRLSTGDVMEVVELQTARGPVLIERTLDDDSHYTVEPIGDRAMWQIFGYNRILAAGDALFLARERNEAVSRGIGQAAAALLACSLLGGLLLIAVVTSVQPLKEGWARFDVGPRDSGPAESSMGSMPLSGGWGYYTLDIECGLDKSSEGVEVFAVAPSGQKHRLARCTQHGNAAEVGHVTKEFRVREPGTWRMSAVHKARPGDGAQAHVTWKVGWKLGSAWFPLGGVLVLMALGLICLALYPLARIFGISRLEHEYEVARAELLLALRRRRETAPENQPEGEPPPPQETIG